MGNFNGYYTNWNNRPTTVSFTVNGEPISSNAQGMSALHKGLELDFIYKIHTKLSWEGAISIGDWKWNSTATAFALDDAGNVTDTVNDNVNEKKNINTVAVSTATFEQREKDFMKKLAPFVETYGKEMLREFYNYWTERNDNGKKMRFEMQKVFQHERRLIAWSKNIKQNKHGKQPTASTDAEWHNIASNYIAAKEAGRI
jgi:hypothetical protein